MTTELPVARGILHQLASRALPKERTSIRVEQLKKELRKAPVINNRLGRSLREYAREEFYNRMTLQQYDLFKEIVAWMHFLSAYCRYLARLPLRLPGPSSHSPLLYFSSFSDDG